MDIGGKEVFDLMIERKRIKIREDSYKEDIRFKKLGYKFMPKRNSLYIIFEEPLDGSIPTNVYIGKTSTSLGTRFSRHVSEIKAMIKGKKEWAGKYRWMYQSVHLRDNELKMELLSMVPKTIVYHKEQEWITYFKLNGFNVFNKPNKRYYANAKISRGR